MKARLPKDYKKQLKAIEEQKTRNLSSNIIRHVCSGFMVVLYKKHEWRKKRCTELLNDVIDYLNNHYDEKEVQEIIKKLDVPLFVDVAETE